MFIIQLKETAMCHIIWCLAGLLKVTTVLEQTRSDAIIANDSCKEPVSDSNEINLINPVSLNNSSQNNL